MTEGATDAAECRGRRVEGGTDAATETAAEAATDATGGTTDLAEVLTVEGFDYDKAIEAIEASDLGTLQKTALGTALGGARDNPELLQGVLEQVRGALGL